VQWYQHCFIGNGGLAARGAGIERVQNITKPVFFAQQICPRQPVIQEQQREQQREEKAVAVIS
jgi:hypothetical protein